MAPEVLFETVLFVTIVSDSVGYVDASVSVGYIEVFHGNVFAVNKNQRPQIRVSC